MSGILRTSLPLILCWSLFVCGSPFIKGADIETINKEWSEREFTARENIHSPFDSNLGLSQEVIFEKGTRLKVWLESAEDWVRVKAYPATERREQTRGRTIIYIFKDDLKKKERTPDNVKALLRGKFDELLVES